MYDKNNSKTLNQCGQLENPKKEKHRPNINIVGVCETRWENNGNFVTDTHWFIYAGGKKNDGRLRLERFIWDKV